MLAYGRQKPAFSHFVARIFKKILAEQLPLRTGIRNVYGTLVSALKRANA
jgi:hypothetical protein